MSKIIGLILGFIVGIIFLVAMIKTGQPSLIKPAKVILNSIFIVGVIFIIIGILTLFK